MLSTLNFPLSTLNSPMFRLKLPPALNPQNYPLGLQRALLLMVIWFCLVLAFALNRYYSFYASYDHGLFNQVFWNNLHGHWFQSSLTSGNSVGTLEDGVIPRVDFLHLGQHFVVDFGLWLPLYALFPHAETLVVLQVGLMAIAGLILYALARQRLSPQLSLWIMGGYYGANAVISPTFANFYEHCQIPFFCFSLLLALERRQWRWFWLLALLVLGIREDTGIILFGIGGYLLVSRRHPWIGAALCLVSFGYVAGLTNLVMPRFSDDNSRLYLATRFKEFIQTDNPSTLQVLWGMVTHPIAVLARTFLPLEARLAYLVAHWLPLAFIPAFSAPTWLMIAPPLLVLFLQTDETALLISWRYALTVIPGLLYGTILWWSRREGDFTARFRLFWRVCLALSLVVTLIYNPNRAFSFAIPDSFRPWVYVPLTQQWAHAAEIRQVLQLIPPTASVSATTHLIPALSGRRSLIRLPQMQLKDDRGQTNPVDYLVADLRQLQVYQVAFKEDRLRLQAILDLVDTQLASAFSGMVQTPDGMILFGKGQPAEAEAQSRYGIVQMQDGVILLGKGLPSNIDALARWHMLRPTLRSLF
jgi:uncharacterized membrane protein